MCINFAIYTWSLFLLFRPHAAAANFKPEHYYGDSQTLISYIYTDLEISAHTQSWYRPRVYAVALITLGSL